MERGECCYSCGNDDWDEVQCKHCGHISVRLHSEMRHQHRSELRHLFERIAQLEARLDAVEKAATPDGCPMDEWADGWNACCRSILAALGGD